MVKEKWLIYKEDFIPLDNYEVLEIVQNVEGTKITMGGNSNDLIIKFSFIDSLRVSDEGRRLRTYNEVEEIQKYREEFYGNPLYKVQNSEFLKWIEIESAGIYTDMVHYAIVTINNIVDMVSSFPPEIEIKNR